MSPSAIKQYAQVAARTSVEEADPHRVVQLLMEGVLDRVARAKGHIERGELALRSEPIARAVTILAELRRSLNHEVGGEIAANLDALYDYMERRLLESNVKNDTALLDEVTGLMRQIKSGWDAIPPEARRPQRATGMR